MSSEGAVRDRNAAGFELIETFRWEPAADFIRLERHLDRLSNSARELGFAVSMSEIDGALREAAGEDVPLRVRLTLSPEGRIDVTTQPFAPLAPDAVWKLKIAKTRLDANDPLLRHKTTRRQVYDAARAEFSRDEADEVILLNGRGEVCEGTITTIFVDDGGGLLLTPPLDCGLLAGVLRAELLDVGKATELALTTDDLIKAKAIFVGNSLRGLIRARLAP